MRCFVLLEMDDSGIDLNSPSIDLAVCQSLPSFDGAYKILATNAQRVFSRIVTAYGASVRLNEITTGVYSSVSHRIAR